MNAKMNTFFFACLLSFVNLFAHAQDDLTNLSLSVKQQSFSVMNQLEGWCSQHKASLLVDFVFLIRPNTIVEIGVFGGKSVIPMAYALKALGHGKIYGIDPWSSDESVVGMEGVNKEWWGSINHEAILQQLLHKINSFRLNNQIELIRKTSAEAPPIYDIDILHIDGNHSEITSLIDVNKWVPFVRSGGLVIFDDVNWDTTGKAVSWLDEHCIKLTEIKGDNIWGVWIKP